MSGHICNTAQRVRLARKVILRKRRILTSLTFRCRMTPTAPGLQPMTPSQGSTNTSSVFLPTGKYGDIKKYKLYQHSNYLFFCLNLRFTSLRPYFEVRETKDILTPGGNDLMAGLGLEAKGYRCYLYMPHKTPYFQHPFIGPERGTEERAKRSAALLACRKLHEDKFLDDKLKPIKRR